MSTFEPVIGLEIHAELKTKSKMFCGCPADHFGTPPNTQTCPVCLGLPGALPVANIQAIDWTIMLGLALGSTIADISKFDRKHYFYPDLPKGYQISQYDQPLCSGGMVSTSFGDVYIRRVHLEEDTGKLQHATLDSRNVTLVDFNRSGVPLVEIVTKPDIRSAQQAKEFLKKLHQIIRNLEISDADMEKGSMRIEPNISLRPIGSKELPAYKVEVKNINSFRFAAAAIEYEIVRHKKILDEGKIPVQETRGWNEQKGITVSQRSKEEAADYRYFPEPDIPPMRFSKRYIENIRETMPELPNVRKERMMKEYELQEKQADVLISDMAKCRLFDEAVIHHSVSENKISAVEVANWIINKVPNASGIDSNTVVKQIVDDNSIVAIDEDELNCIVSEVVSKNPKAVADYKGGKEQSLMFLLGQIKRTLPKVQVSVILEALKKQL